MGRRGITLLLVLVGVSIACVGLSFVLCPLVDAGTCELLPMREVLQSKSLDGCEWSCRSRFGD